VLSAFRFQLVRGIFYICINWNVMELILKSDNHSKMEKVLALAHKLGISVIQKADTSKATSIPPKGKSVSAVELLETFGKGPDFPSAEEIRAKAWPSSW
jgi:hypothetical protein